MRRGHCHECRVVRPFQRAFGWGTFFAVLVTLGGWVLALPFYPVRCRECGLPWGVDPSQELVPRSQEPAPRPWGPSDWVILGALLIAVAVIVFGVVTGRFQ
jgi:hypothetical protein